MGLQLGSSILRCLNAQRNSNAEVADHCILWVLRQPPESPQSRGVFVGEATPVGQLRFAPMFDWMQIQEGQLGFLTREGGQDMAAKTATVSTPSLA